MGTHRIKAGSALVLALMAGVWLSTEPAPAAQRMAPEKFLVSFWCAPPPQETTLARYQEIAAAGFNAVLPPCGGPVTPALNRQILELCGQTGLKAFGRDVYVR